MNKRIMERERKRTEKTRCKTRTMRLDCFIHADGTNLWDGTNGIIEGAYFRVVVNGRWNFDKPHNMSVVAFITKLTETGNLPFDLPHYEIGRKKWRYVWEDGHNMKKLGKVTFDYKVNEWNESQNPGMAHPWMARSWDDCGIGYSMMRDWEAPGNQVKWITPLFMKFTDQYLNDRIATHNTKLVMAKLRAPWPVAEE